MVTLRPIPRLGTTIISIIVTAGFLGVLILLLVRPLSIAGDVGDLLKILTGILGAKFGDVVAYHINSTVGSKDKDATISEAVSGLATSVPVSSLKPPGSA